MWKDSGSNFGEGNSFTRSTERSDAIHSLLVDPELSEIVGLGLQGQLFSHFHCWVARVPIQVQPEGEFNSASEQFA